MISTLSRQASPAGDFYDPAENTHNAPQALADVQRDWLVKLRKERGLLDAVRLAGAFIRAHNEPLSVVAMRVSNPDCSPVGIGSPCA